LPTPYQALNLSKTELKGSGTAPRSCNWRNVPLATAGHMRRVLRSVGTDKALASLEQLGAAWSMGGNEAFEIASEEHKNTEAKTL